MEYGKNVYEASLRGGGAEPRIAFTLAEVLITLGIIGVVASMTMPNLIVQHKAKVMESQFKKAYSVLANATKMLVQQDNSPYELTMAERVEQYSKVLQAQKYVKVDRWTTWKNLSGKGWLHLGPISTAPVLRLNDGSMVIIGSYNWLFVDINGLAKGPNKAGYDFHQFKILPDNNLVPVTHPAHDTRQCTLSNPQSTDTYLGYGCTQYAISNTNPDGEGDYWHNFLKMAK